MDHGHDQAGDRELEHGSRRGRQLLGALLGAVWRPGLRYLIRKRLMVPTLHGENR